jgi:hypothetical protein
MGFGQYSGRSYQGRGAERTGTKRERHTFDAAALAHAWAHQQVEWGNRSDRRMFFESDAEEVGKLQRISTIYSYGHHFPIASLYRTKRGENVVLFNSGSYSISTTQHQGYVSSAVPSAWRSYSVNDPRRPSDAGSDYTRRILASIEHVRNPRSRRTLGAMAQAQATAAEARELAKLFGFKWTLPRVAFTNKDRERAAELEAKHEERERTKEARRVAREAERAQRHRAQIHDGIIAWRAATPDYRNSYSNVWLEPPHGFSYSEEWTPEDGAEWTRRRAEFDANRLNAWREHGGSGYSLQGTYLRVADGAHCTLDHALVGDIETSKSATFPLEHGVKALPLIRRIVSRAALGDSAKPATLYARNGHTIHLGHYAIDRIERRPDGVHVIAGCHDVPLTEVEHVAAELGL